MLNVLLLDMVSTCMFLVSFVSVINNYDNVFNILFRGIIEYIRMYNFLLKAQIQF